MKTTQSLILFALFVIASARADTTLRVGDVDVITPGGPCWDDTLLSIGPDPLAAVSNSFTVTGISGTGYITSGVQYVVESSSMEKINLYTYHLDLSGMSGLTAGHCISLLIHFGRPLTCDYAVMLLTNFSAPFSVDVSSATLAPYGDITFDFGTGCLLPSQNATWIGMVSDATPVLGTVTVIDDYSGSNGSGETRVNVGAVVPDIPPDWAYPVQLPYTVPIPFPTFQGSLVTNPFPYLPPSNGLYNFVFSLTDGSNGLPASGIFTQAVSVVNGLFTTPLIFDPAVFTGGARWLNISIQPPNGGNFIPLSPPLQIAPAPQAIYAYSAGVVASLSPGQAVTSLNGLTGGVALQAANGIIIGTNGNTLVLASQAAVPSDRNIKTGFMPVSPEEILGRLAALPIQSWRFTNEAAGVRHVGPMAQDFKAAFDLGNDDKSIAFVDGQGVALAAIQGLNAKLSQKDAEIQTLKAKNDSLAERLSQLEAAVKLLTEENGLNRN